MGEVKKGDVTQLLSRRSEGDRAVLDRLLPVVYDELRRMAARYLRRERRQHTLQPTVLVHARERAADKRGGGVNPPAARRPLAVGASNRVDIMPVDDALNRLAAIDPDQVRLVELRFFGGLTIQETAEVLGWSSGSVKREWTIARAWLQREMSGGTSR